MIKPLLIAAFVALPLLAAEAQSLPELRVAFSEDADALDPALSRAYVGRVAMLNMCDSLFTYNDKLELIPRLATGYEWTDATTLVVKLRPNVRFHDNTPVDAAAVKYNMERQATLSGSARKGDVGSLDHTEVIDPLTVKFVLKTPDVVFLSQLGVRAGTLVSPKAAEAAGKDFPLHPVCAGPYKFVERVAQDHITIERVPDYWDAANYHFSKVTFLPIPDSSVRLANLKAGAVDINMNVPPIDAESVRANPKLAMQVFDGLGYNGITVNQGRGAPGQTPFGTDARVRKAFELAIDREALVQAVFAGAHAPVAQPVPPTSPFYAPSVTVPKRDVARARALLAEAGVKTPLTVNLIVINAPEQVQIGEVLQSMTAEAGFDLKLTAMEFAASLDRSFTGNYTSYLIGWTGRPDADGNVRDLLYSGSQQNAAAYSNKTFDGLLDQERAVTDVAARRALFAKAFAQLHEDQPIIYLYAPRWLFGLSSRIKGFVPVADGMLRLNGVSAVN